ncbi:CDP-alcohol phosphatidyltransferase family protein [Lampropedia puyangensis]|uniref:CDP-alcohol phosphatidyltransferase family protein n=2 Tax=Lampropedia puyangensis TaxID=1330072 RepID=A0A4S8FD83_9BURK|nr:CDP-alcohol phosphatidyltransferase family protein [Lampropedia puyangensis]
MARRPIQARSNPWIQRLSKQLAQTGITPNAISVASVAFAALGAASLLWLPAGGNMLGCILGIQLRLLCNVIDGMVAIEGGKKTPTGALYNEVPDRIADSILIVALGYAVGHDWLGWLGALAAALTAYVRVLGGSLGLAQSFRGPMAKQHRMALMTAACAIALLEAPLNHTQYALLTACAVITTGSLITCLTRLNGIATALKQQ